MSSIPDCSLLENESRMERTISNLAHVPAFAVLTFLWLKSFVLEKKKRQTRTYNVLILLGLVLFAVSDELHQYFVPGRSASITDLGRDFLGILFGISAYLFSKPMHGEFLNRNRHRDSKLTGNSHDPDTKNDS